MEKAENSLVNFADRAADGNLLPETRERVLKSIRKHLQRAGYVNISRIAARVGLSRQTTRKLIDEVLEEWREHDENQILAQIAWHESVLEDLDRRPETFTKERVEITKLKSVILGRTNTLRKLLVAGVHRQSSVTELLLVRQAVRAVSAPLEEDTATDAAPSPATENPPGTKSLIS